MTMGNALQQHRTPFAWRHIDALTQVVFHA
jgi:hypothetical protein